MDKKTIVSLDPLTDRDNPFGAGIPGEFESKMPPPDTQAENDIAEMQRQADVLQPTEEEEKQSQLADVASTIGKIGSQVAGAFGGFKPQTAPLEAADQLAATAKKDRQTRIQSLLEKAKMRREESQKVRQGQLSDVMSQAKLRGIDQDQQDRDYQGQPISSSELAAFNAIATRRGVDKPLFSETMTRKEAAQLSGILKDLPTGNWTVDEVPQADGMVESYLIDKTTGKKIPLGRGKKSSASGLDAIAPDVAVDNANKLLTSRGLKPLSYGVSQRDVQSALEQTGEVRRAVGNLANVPENTQDPHSWLSGQSSETKKSVAQVQGTFNKNLKDAQEAQKEISTLGTLAEEYLKGNAIAGQTLKNRIPRVIAGEKGVLTDQDVNRLAGAKTLYERAVRAIDENLIKGVAITDRDIKEIKEVIKTITDVYSTAQKNAENRALTQLQTFIGPNADARLLYSKQTSPAQTTTPSQDSSVKSVQVLIGGKWVQKQLSPSKIEDLKKKNPSWIRE
jgi:hypothetical protein